MVTTIKGMRSDSVGLEGSIQNAVHHAFRILPFIDDLKDKVGIAGFKVWKQGSNVHEFVTYDNRKFTLRPFKNFANTEYVGVRLSMRISRSVEIRLMDITDPTDCGKLAAVMREIAKPAQGLLGKLQKS